MLHQSKTLLVIIFIFSICQLCFSQSNIDGYVTPTSIGDKLVVPSKILKEHRMLNIYTPKSYSKDSLKKYPVIFVLDGTMNKDFIHVAGIVQYGSASWINIVPESIVIGLPNTHQNKDFVSKKNDQYSHSGGSTNFIKFIEHELIPFLEEQYRMTEERTIIGKALGGLLVNEILIKRPHIFSKYIMLSPILSWDNSAILKMDPIICLSKKIIYIGVGEESRLKDLSAKKMYLKFKNLNVSSIKVHYEYFEDLNRSNIMFSGTYSAFTKIFKAPK